MKTSIKHIAITGLLIVLGLSVSITSQADTLPESLKTSVVLDTDALRQQLKDELFSDHDKAAMIVGATHSHAEDTAQYETSLSLDASTYKEQPGETVETTCCAPNAEASITIENITIQ